MRFQGFLSDRDHASNAIEFTEVPPPIPAVIADAGTSQHRAFVRSPHIGDFWKDRVQVRGDDRVRARPTARALADDIPVTIDPHVPHCEALEPIAERFRTSGFHERRRGNLALSDLILENLPLVTLDNRQRLRDRGIGHEPSPDVGRLLRGARDWQHHDDL